MNNITSNIMRTRFIISLLLLTLAALTLTGCEEIAGNQPSTTGGTSGGSSDSVATTLPPAYPNTLRVWKDFSGSADDAVLIKIADDLIAEIARHQEQIVGIELVLFSRGTNSTLEEIPEKFLWGAPPVIKEFQPDLENAPPEAKMFKEAMKTYLDEQKRRYDEQQARILNEYRKRVSDQLTRFKDHLLHRPDEKAPCTRFTILAARMQREDLPYNLTLTDGWADCPEEKAGQVTGITIKGKHVIIQLGRGNDSATEDNEIPQREAFLRTLFPNAEVLPAYMASKAIGDVLQ